jgi:hypothetical protein
MNSQATTSLEASQHVGTAQPSTPAITSARPTLHGRACLRVLCVILFIAWLGQAKADTMVSGSVSGSWTSAGSPYLVVGNVLVIPGNSLIIQSNVQVRFQGPYDFQVNGTLQASGTVFTNAAAQWNGIYFNGSSSDSFLSYCQIYGSTNSGIRITDCTPALGNCIIANCSAPDYGGGLYAHLISGAMVVNHCTFTNNTALGGGGACVEQAGGTVEFDGCLVASNQAPPGASGGGGLQLGIYRPGQNVNVTLKNCEISGNQSGYVGGGIYAETYDAPGALGMYNCKVATNSVGSGIGGGLFVQGHLAAQVVNCTFVGNNPEALYIGGPQNITLLTNSIVYYNNAGGQQLVGNVVVDHSDVEGGVQPGSGNISFDPGLNPTNLFLLTNSVCIDAGNPDPAYNDVCFAPLPCGVSQGTARNDVGASGGPGACGWTSPCPPVIDTPPRDQKGSVGHTATFTVSASGIGSLNYQWYFNTNTLLTNATSASLTLTNLQATNAGKYSVAISSQYGSTNSPMAQLTIYDPYTELQIDWYFEAYLGAGLYVAGQPGATYVLKYATDLRNSNWATWTPLATNTMGSSGWWFFLDEESPYAPTRFYQVRRKP